MSLRRNVSLTSKTLLPLLFALLAGAAAAQDTAPAPSLTGVTWEWHHFSNGRYEMTIHVDSYSVTFAEDGNYFGRADCNSVRGTFSVTGSSIVINPGPATLVACEPGSLGDAFTDLLLRATAFSFADDGDLLLELPADGGTLRLRARPQVTGTVTYLQRVALPPDAVIRVQIQDVSVLDAPTTIVAEQVFSADGAQVPFSFTVPYSARSVLETRRYSLAARITDGEGRLLFISDEYVPVITGGSPTQDIEVVLVQVTR